MNIYLYYYNSMKCKQFLVQLIVVVSLNFSAILAFYGNYNVTLHSLWVDDYDNITEKVEAQGMKFESPVEVLDIFEDENNYIVVKTYEKSFVKAPLDIIVYIENLESMKGVRFNIFGYECVAMGFETLSIVDGMMVKAGDVIGSLTGDKLYLKVYKNENRVSLKTLRLLFNV